MRLYWFRLMFRMLALVFAALWQSMNRILFTSSSLSFSAVRFVYWYANNERTMIQRFWFSFSFLLSLFASYTWNYGDFKRFKLKHNEETQKISDYYTFSWPKTDLLIGFIWKRTFGSISVRCASFFFLSISYVCWGARSLNPNLSRLRSAQTILKRVSFRFDLITSSKTPNTTMGPNCPDDLRNLLIYCDEND